jgi:uncharacterized protein with HEPN domain
MQRDNAYLLDIVEAARLVRQYVADKTLEEFLKMYNARTPSSGDSS